MGVIVVTIAVVMMGVVVVTIAVVMMGVVVVTIAVVMMGVVVVTIAVVMMGVVVVTIAVVMMGVVVVTIAVVMAGRAVPIGGGQLVHRGSGDDLELRHDRLERLLPALVVAVLAHGIRLPALHRLDEMVAEVVPAEVAPFHQGHRHGESPALPGRVEHQLTVEPGRGGWAFDVEGQGHRRPSGSAGLGHSHHGVAGDEPRQLLLGEVLGAFGTLRQHQVPVLGA